MGRCGGRRGGDEPDAFLYMLGMALLLGWPLTLAIFIFGEIQQYRARNRAYDDDDGWL
jgi:hypothetical protein